MNMSKSFLAVGAVVMLFLFSCANDNTIEDKSFEVTVRIPVEPDNINPTRSTSSYATPIESLIMYPLAEYDPFTFEMSPLLVKGLARKEEITEGPFTGGLRFYYEMRPQARWDDGSPVTAEDYLFTLKAVMNPLVSAASWRGFLAFIKDVEIDPDDPAKFAVVVSEPYMLAEVVTCNFNIFPKHVYDPNGHLDHLTLRQLHDEEGVESLIASDSSLQLFADEFASVRFNRDVAEGSGPYRLVEWETGQHITLERKKDWWGDDVADAPDLMHAYPDKIVYRIIADEAIALNALKDGTIDLIADVSANNFVELRDDSEWSGKLSFLTPQVMRYNYLELNNRHPILAEYAVRRALAHAVDYDAIIESLVQGMATRTIGPFHPSKNYYHDGLEPLEYDLDQARSVLEEGGWSDTNGDGTVDKMIDGKRTELQLEVTVSQRPTGQQVALLIKESASRVGIGLDMVISDNLMQDVRQRDFEVLPMRNSTSPSINDPYQLWHSESDQPGGINRSGYHDETADALIERIRTTDDEAERIQLFRDLQEEIYEDQPVIFLYVPLERIVTSNRIVVKPSSRRPGYFENLFQLNSAD